MSSHLPNCDIALYVEGDLPLSRVAGCEKHLEHCPQCRQSLEELRASQHEFRRMTRDLVAASDLHRVRSAVLRRLPQIDQQRRVWERLEIQWAGLRRRRYFVTAAVTAVLAISIGLWREFPGERPVHPRASLSEHHPQKESAPTAVNAQSAQDIAPRLKKSKMSISRRKPESGSAIRQAQLLQDPAVAEPGPEPGLGERSRTMKILTQNPDVIIYWVLEENGGH